MDEYGVKRKVKDPKAPTRVRSAYQLWANDTRPELQAANPNASMGDISKLLGARWKETDEAVKSEWQRKSEEDKARFNKEMETYVPPEGQGKGKKQKKAKDPNAPKRATTAYFFFLAEERPRTKAEVPGISVTELSKVVGAKWKQLSEEQKAPYEAKAEADKARYAAEKAQYDANQSSAAAEESSDYGAQGQYSDISW
eukprot:CAMPEP_0205904098 /NCGR_PEP_ID=MMETSP1325-20131115/515_1 /ASSEMBLY_ACC=CAM_ASM_000708 /TAXON_ID=236786 /ORGANISM="Florenciella sp., Strain RCC1007" /LENGTH=197 /DNA_ID=CAMNT_0053269827 /DNA_START=19 /DNA_END=612 /DNA_ORIENTATION=-